MSLDMFLRVFTVGNVTETTLSTLYATVVGPALGLLGVGSSVRGFLRVHMGQEGGDGEAALCSYVVWIS